MHSNFLYRNTNISDGANNLLVPDGQINNEEVFLGAACSNVVGEPPPTSKNSTSTKHLDKEKSVKTEPYSKNTVMTIDTENTDSRLINFKGGFNFEEHYQEWSTNVSNENKDNLYLGKMFSLILFYIAIILNNIILNSDNTEMWRLWN